LILIKKLSTVIKWRNFCAHRAYLMNFDEQTNYKTLSKEVNKMDKLVKFIEDCFWELNNELKKLDDLKTSLSI
jgi:hypothetical protein